jgi:hypothetical protein
MALLMDQMKWMSEQMKQLTSQRLGPLQKDNTSQKALAGSGSEGEEDGRNNDVAKSQEINLMRQRFSRLDSLGYGLPHSPRQGTSQVAMAGTEGETQGRGVRLESQEEIEAIPQHGIGARLQQRRLGVPGSNFTPQDTIRRITLGAEDCWNLEVPRFHCARFGVDQLLAYTGNWYPRVPGISGASNL